MLAHVTLLTWPIESVFCAQYMHHSHMICHVMLLVWPVGVQSG